MFCLDICEQDSLDGLFISLFSYCEISVDSALFNNKVGPVGQLKYTRSPTLLKSDMYKRNKCHGVPGSFDFKLLTGIFWSGGNSLSGCMCKFI